MERHEAGADSLDYGFGVLTFEATYSHGKPSRVTVQISGESTLEEVLEAFEGWLRVAGYVFDGRVDIVPDDIIDADPGYQSFAQEENKL